MNAGNRALHILFLAALILGSSAQVQAASDTGFRLWVEPLDFWVIQTENDTNSSKLQEYRDLSNGLWAGVKMFGESADLNRNLAIRLAGIEREDAHYSLSYRNEGKYAATFDHNRIPHRFGNDAILLWDRPAANRLEFPAPLQGIPTSGIPGLLATANTIDLGLRRDRTKARFDLGKMSRLAWGFEVTREDREGTRPLGAPFGFSPVTEIPEPIDYATTGVEVRAELNGKNGGARFGYRYSTFENKYQSVTWDNPFTAVDAVNNPASGRFALAPDNEASLFFADGRLRAGGWWLSGNAVLNKLTQDEPLVPYTINTAIIGTDARTGAKFNAASAPLPVSRADRGADVMNFSANAGRDLGKAFSLTLRYRYYDYDNTSPRIEFPGYVRTDATWFTEGLLTVPFAYTRDSVGAELGWQATKNTDVTLAYERKGFDRTFREIENSEEDVLKLSVDSRLNDKVSLRASWANGDRSTSHYDVEAQEVYFVDPPGINNQPGLRKFDEAVREVDDYELTVQLFPTDAWNLSLGISGRNEDYPESEFGLVSDEIASYNFELGYTPGENLNFFVFGHQANRDVFQRARQSGGTLSTRTIDNWSALFNEDTTTLGLGVSSKRDNGFGIDFSANRSESDGEGDFATPGGGLVTSAVDIDNYEDIELTSVGLKLSYEVSPRTSFGVFYRYEDYSINSFILQGLKPFLAGTLLLLGNEGDYQASIYGIQAKFRIL